MIPFTKRVLVRVLIHVAFVVSSIDLQPHHASAVAHEEPGTEAEIEGFTQQNYGVTFPMMSKV